jgi:YVTN family beta-propeller protein
MVIVASWLAVGCFGGGGVSEDGTDTEADGTAGPGPGTEGSETDPDPDGTGDPDSGSDGSTGGPPDENPGLLDAPTRGGPIHINDEITTLAVANKATDDVTLFSLPDVTELARISVGDEPVSVAWAPDNSTLYVTNRGSGTVQKIVDADTAAPSVDGEVFVGSETIAAAMSPRGRFLYVTSWVDGTLSVVNTTDMAVEQVVDLGGAPYAVCVTNDVDEDEDDETIFVTDFYGRPEAAPEGTDAARYGRVFRVSAGDLAVTTARLDPFPSSGIPGFEDTGFYPNQLYSCVVNDDKVYVTAIGASPAPFAGATDFHQNVQGMVGVLDVDGGAEDRDRSANLNQLVDGLAAPKRFVAVPADIAFAENSEFGYIASTASNSVLRVDWSQSPPVAGSPSGAAFLETAPSPVGIAIADKIAYTYNEVDRSVSVIDLARQETVQVSVPSAPQPGSAAEQAALRGQKFFNTGLARWSTNGWVSCLACHPAGLTDNVTWSFPAGPRQTVDLSGSFDRGGGIQRVFNWTAIFDEVHDFELNTRGVAGGTGAIVTSADLNEDGTANAAARIDFVGPGGPADPLNGFNIGSTRAVAASGALPDDWDDIEAYIMTLRPPRAAYAYAGDPDAGRVVFEEAGCQNCHGGPLWTLSELYYTPQLDGDARGLTLASQGVTSIDARADQVVGTDPSQIFVLETDPNGAPHRHTCVVREVGTFAELGPAGHGADELRQSGTPAQGVEGFNVPSLLGVSMGGPYLHNGAAETLDELLDPAGEFGDHLRAGNQVFSPTDDELRDLIAFLRSIDDDTETIAVPSDMEFCPTDVSF